MAGAGRAAARARHARRRGAYDDAIEVLGRIIERNPEDIQALLRAPTRASSRRDYEGALADADRVLELDPEDDEALMPRTVALLALERVDEAHAAIDDLEALYRDESLGLHGSAALCVARRRSRRRRAISSAPRSAPTHASRISRPTR